PRSTIAVATNSDCDFGSEKKLSSSTQSKLFCKSDEKFSSAKGAKKFDSSDSDKFWRQFARSILCDCGHRCRCISLVDDRARGLKTERGQFAKRGRCAALD